MRETFGQRLSRLRKNLGLKQIETGVIGKLVEIESADGDTISIAVE